MTNPGRLKDLSDVLELIKVLKLSEEFADRLDPFVRDKFLELSSAAREGLPCRKKTAAKLRA